MSREQQSLPHGGGWIFYIRLISMILLSSTAFFYFTVWHRLAAIFDRSQAAAAHVHRSREIVVVVPTSW